MSRTLSPQEKKLREVDAPAQNVTLHRETQVISFSAEEELKCLVDQGEWELMVETKAFQKRSAESQVQLFRKAVDQRTTQLRATLNYLINRGPAQRQAAINVLQRIQKLEQIRDDCLQNFYRQGPAALDEKAGVKIEYY